VVHSKDNEEVAVAHEVKSPENQPPDNDGAVLVR